MNGIIETAADRIMNMEFGASVAIPGAPAISSFILPPDVHQEHMLPRFHKAKRTVPSTENKKQSATVPKSIFERRLHIVTGQ